MDAASFGKFKTKFINCNVGASDGVGMFRNSKN